MQPADEDGNAFKTLAHRPRLLLLILAGWSILSVMAETFTSSGLFLENHLAVPGQGTLELELDGALGGFALGWQGIPLAALYIYCFRDPPKYRPVFFLALIHMGTLAASQLYHWLVTSDFTFESIIVPLAGSAALAALVFLHLFQPRDEPLPGS
jgi:hypothetical protein